MKKLKIYHISDTHGYHELLPKENFENIDILIHSGDFSNNRQLHINELEAENFLLWYASLKVPYKILVAGNHDAYASLRTKELRIFCENNNIIYLENESIEIEGLKIFGSPLTPNFGNWYFMKKRDKLHDYWKNIPLDTDIIITHGPPYSKLDLSHNRDHVLEFCGCKSLQKHINIIKPKLVCFGHIHSTREIINAGILFQENILYSNGSVVTDGKFGKLSSEGNIFEYENEIIKIW